MPGPGGPGDGEDVEAARQLGTLKHTECSESNSPQSLGLNC